MDLGTKCLVLVAQIWKQRFYNRTVLNIWCVGRQCLLLFFMQIQLSWFGGNNLSFRNKMYHNTTAAVLVLSKLEAAGSVAVHHSILFSHLSNGSYLLASMAQPWNGEQRTEFHCGQGCGTGVRGFGKFSCLLSYLYSVILRAYWNTQFPTHHWLCFSPISLFLTYVHKVTAFFSFKKQRRLINLIVLI